MLSCTSRVNISIPQSSDRDHMSISADTRIAVEQYREELFPQYLDFSVVDSGLTSDISLDIENYLTNGGTVHSANQEIEYLFAAIARSTGEMTAYVRSYNIDAPDREDAIVELNSSATMSNSNLSTDISVNTHPA